MPTSPDLFQRTIEAFVHEFEGLSAQGMDPMEAYHRANYTLSALASLLAEHIDLEVHDVVAGIVDRYLEIAERAGVDFSLYEE
jgi:hypothetical protein